MTPLKDIGECLISDGQHEYFFRPSFAAMARIGEPAEIVQAFYDLHNDEFTPLLRRALAAYGHIPSWLIKHACRVEFSKKVLMAAYAVLHACSEDDVSSLTGWLKPGKTGRWSFVWRKGALTPHDMVIIAQSLMMHGIIGKAKIRQLQRYESNETTSGFRAIEYINAARAHLGMTRDEAEKLTMTEFILLLNAKYPNQKGFTREEYDAIMDEDERRWAEMMDKQQN